MANSLPDCVDPQRWAKAGRSLHGQLPFSRMGRLEESLARTTGGAEVDLFFDLGAGGYPRLRGSVTGAPELVCQRCMEPMKVPIAADFRLVISTPGSKAPVEEGYDTVEIDGGSLSVIELVEDEIILALPDFPKHPEAACLVEPSYSSDGGGHGESSSPFAALAEMKPRA